MDDPIRWTVPGTKLRRAVLAGTAIGIPAIALTRVVQAPLFPRPPPEIIVILGVFTVSMLLYAFSQRDRHYTLDAEGFTVQVGNRRPRRHAWSEFRGWQPHEAAISASVPPTVGAATTLNVFDVYRHAIVLHPRSFWGWGSALVVDAAVAPDVHARVASALPQAKSRLNGISILIVLGVVVLATVWFLVTEGPG